MGVGLDDVRAEFDGLADEREDLVEVAVHHVAAGLGVRLEDERLDHQRHAVAVAVRFDPEDVLDALVRDLGLAGDAEEVHDHAGRIEPQPLLDGRLDHAAEERARELRAIDVGDVGAEHERGLLAARDGLEIVRLPDGELDGIGRGGHDRPHRLLHVLDALEEAALVEETVVDGDVEALPT